ncbi:hypothetical protein FHS95_002256 [Sphingomonas naasensis]|uniref:Uncharacterized protein n=1 Tax=Sphingomonas naasensis TaxID=1344951 RepID=A0A4S1WR74_9SPHN|nr:hypothetical protein [Sphingomonas naasensis]NIJ20564.1 hypothetical protein [Sphingomonas naasensis]TGX44647.1 hypothetical protein E5A74_07745 [Sphingomonas naasensis]
MSVIGWKLDRDQRTELLAQFPPEWPDVIADHVTLAAYVDAEALLPAPVHAEIVGEISDGEGLQAMVVALDGGTDRPDGSVWHITWSLDLSGGRKPVESNALIAERGWRPLAAPVAIRLTPARLD